MAIFEGMFKNGVESKNSVESKKEITKDDANLSLRKEELDIAKSKIQKGDVEIGKEIIEEHKQVDVPVKREEVVIERRSLHNEASDSPITDEATIKIPLSEEKVNVGKHTVITGEISAHKREIENTEHIDETLKHEEAHITKTGDANIIDNKGDH
ncbi:YsnF/AvaK domain-containing protein [Clostridium lacusfryxellense]|uniref:YsnF/AvaK domain-containing protein n=1 Tax=Clostridium lacusfryxellense TaxID=205328 RepID=UPI001C0E795B|nr:YsnF/AvaK domain-containing protein [Clostridium lacusfryxellense]MBU3112374.1 YsnF/AvaK domain-containing protein [Clostridium lacusfryxellense]